MLKQVLDMEAKYLQDIHGKGDSHQGGMDASSNNFDDEMIPDHMRNPYGGMPGVPMYINKSIM